ncbi:MAG: SocA family protein [Bacteroidales bacterium]|nr:SocA family protein [Bacteroidales bacterium]
MTKQEQLDKVGNALIYLSSRITDTSKSKLLKLLYIIDELSIKKSGIPVFNLNYQVWKYGPVEKEVYTDLSENPVLLSKYVKRINKDDNNYIVPVAEFCDDEFTNNDIKLMDKVIELYGSKTAKELVAYTHRPHSPWYNKAVEKQVYEDLINERINTTDYYLEMDSIISHNETLKAIYNDFQELC